MISPASDLPAGLVTSFELRILLDPVLKGLILLTATWLVTRLAPVRGAGWRSSLWTLLICALILVPVSSLLEPQLTAPVVTIQDADDPEAAPVQERSGGSVDFAVAVPASREDHGPETTAPSVQGVRPVVWALLVWSVGALALLTRMSWRLVQTRRLVRAATPVTHGRMFDLLGQIRDEYDRPEVALSVSAHCVVPFVAGGRKPHLVLPPAAAGWSDAELIAVFRHELSHICRYDLLRLVLAEIACALHWYNPLVWRAARAAALSHEMACDERAVRAGGDARQYARTLLSLASRMTVERTAPVPGLARISGIESRLHHVLTSDLGRSGRGLQRTVFVLLLGLLIPVLAGSAVRSVREEPFPEASTEQPSAQMTLAIAGAGSSSPTAPDGDIHDLSLGGETDAVLAILTAHPDRLEARDGAGMTPLAQAAWGGHLRLLEALLDRGADPDALNANGLTPLFCALDRGNLRVAERLADADADLRVTGYRGWTLLHAAVRARDVAFVNRLLAAGLDPNAVTTRGRTPLHFAERFQNRAMMAALTSAGAIATPNPAPWPTPVKPTGKNLLYMR